MSYTVDLRERVVNAVVERRYTLQQTAEIFSVSKSSIERWLRRYRQQGDFSSRTSPGRPSALAEHRAWVEQGLANDFTHDQRCDALFGHSGVRISRAPLCRWVRRLGSTRKKDAIRE